jgi:superfamily II DNA or RNA helicase
MQQTENGFSRALVVRQTALAYPGDGDSPIQEIFRELVKDVARNDLIENDVCEALDRGRRCLILSQWKEHCEILAEGLVQKGRSPFVLSGTIAKKKRSAILNSIQDTGLDKELLIIATGQYLGEGFDCPQVDTLFLAFPISFKGKLVQYVGRALRSHEGKRSVIVYDYADSGVPILRKMHARRLKTYKLLRFASENGPAKNLPKTVNALDMPLQVFSSD